MGAVSGLLAKKGTKVGFLGGMDIPLIHKFQGGFIAGAMYVNKDLREPGMILGQYAGKDPTAFNDPKTGESIAVNFFKQGASIVYHASGGTGAGLFKAAKDLGKLAIGVDSDQGLIYATSKSAEEKKMSEFILTSMLKRVDNAVFLTGKELIETGKNAGGYVTFSLRPTTGWATPSTTTTRSKLQPITGQAGRPEEEDHRRQDHRCRTTTPRWPSGPRRPSDEAPRDRIEKRDDPASRFF